MFFKAFTCGKYWKTVDLVVTGTRKLLSRTVPFQNQFPVPVFHIGTISGDLLAEACTTLNT
jgi:hypothetical protein